MNKLKKEFKIHPPIWFYYVIFTISGFSGLIYESIWSHYLKLFLGHAALAQSLVLIIFMGGMAIGAWWASRFSEKLKSPILIYVVVELIIGCFALIFHDTFTSLISLLYESALPSINSPFIGSSLKWLSASLMILPQSILLGMTFPLMTAGILRRYPNSPGTNISTLYFANSIGAAIGVLASGFVLIKALGLPGTIFTAGILNIFLALVTWMILRIDVYTPTSKNLQTTQIKKDYKLENTFLLIACITGLASFIYEISWIRMLSMVLGSTTHSFELMLSAFITGLALGGLWIRKKIDTIDSPIIYLATIQIFMGIFAILTIPVYVQSFEWMSDVITTIDNQSDKGFFYFTVFSHVIALLVMLPATFCAGMTLPLITYVLLKNNVGEKSIGKVYSINTLGAILGVLFAIHIGLPFLGIKLLIITGAILDISLGVLLYFITASVAFLTSQTDQHSALLTNGKIDASIVLNPSEKKRAIDEATMTLLGTFAFAYKPDIKTVANIGMGSGMTTHTILHESNVELVDTIEIESSIIEASKNFGAVVSKTFKDPRSKIHIDDAKTFFSIRNKSYDLIVAEPSNPWVSGVSSLFSKEFYKTIKRHINDDGLFVQWIQLYEFNDTLLLSILSALSENFEDYAIYLANDVDIVIVAKKSVSLNQPDWSNLLDNNFKSVLKRQSINSSSDLEIRKVGDKQILEPLFLMYNTNSNSDYYPFVDLNAGKARFKNSKAALLFNINDSGLPILEMLNNQNIDFDNITSVDNLYFSYQTDQARLIAKEFIPNVNITSENTLTSETKQKIINAKLIAKTCEFSDNEDVYEAAVDSIGKRTVPYLSKNNLKQLFTLLRGNCDPTTLPPYQDARLLFFEAVGQRDINQIVISAESLLSKYKDKINAEDYNYISSAILLSYIKLEKPKQAANFYLNFIQNENRSYGALEHEKLLLSILSKMEAKYSSSN